MLRATVKRLTLYRLAIPLRRKVSHSANERVVADPIVTEIELTGGTIGYGETLARTYVTGESDDSVMHSLREVFLPALLEFRADTFFEALEALDSLPWIDPSGQLLAAARAAVELALIDACSRRFSVGVEAAARWAGLAGFGPPGSAERVRYSAVLASASLAGTLKWLRLAWWYGLRDFKLKVGGPDDDLRVRKVMDYLRGAVLRDRATLRLDANGAWEREEAIELLGDWRGLSIASIEQPLAKGREADLPLLKDLVETPLMHDESLVTLEDGQRLIAQGVADGFNVRISKCGGLLPALRLAQLARRNGVTLQLGCMVGETSILSAAGRRFLETVPGVRFAEGFYGPFLLREDVVRDPLRLRYGGRGRALGPLGWGIQVEPARLERLSVEPPLVFEL